METSFSQLKQREVVNIFDGKRLGKVINVVFSFPEGRVSGIVVPGGKGFRWGKTELFIPLKNIHKIGVDVVLADLKSAPSDGKKRGKFDVETVIEEPIDRRDYGEYE